MKKLTCKIGFAIFSVFYSLLAKASIDPVVYVKGNNASTIHEGTDFYALEPSNGSYTNQYYYIPYIVFSLNDSSVPSNATQTYEWSVTGGTAMTNKDVQLFSAKWDNTKNYNGATATKTIRLKVTFTWTPQDKPKQTKTITSIRSTGANEAQPIEVKYISEPSSITFNGSTLSNNNTLAFACGAGQKTISWPAVATDPNAPVTYYISYPPDWTGPATSNVPNVSVNTHVNKGGTIKVEAKRNDTNNFRTKISINITRPTPTKPVINSADILLCNPQTITASASNATSYTWVADGGITATPQANTSSALITGVSDGTVKVAAVSSVCAMTSAFSTPIKVKKSPPVPASLLVTANGGNSPDFMCNGAGLMLNAYTAEPGTVFGMWKTSDPANTILNGNGGSAYFNSYVNNCYGIDIVVSNCFGSVQKGITICVDNCVKHTPKYTLYPNPASDYIHLAFDDVSNVKLLPLEMKLFGEAEEKEIKSVDLTKYYNEPSFQLEKSVAVNVANLPRGTFYVHLIYESQSETMRVVLN